MLTDEQARAAGFRDAADHDAYAKAMREESLTQDWIEAGGPSPMEMWEQLNGRDPIETVPLTVEQAARRMGFRSTKSIRRRLPALEAMDPPGAYRTTDSPRAPWRIIPAALDRLREVETVEPKPAAPPRAKRKSAPAKKRSATRWEV